MFYGTLKDRGLVIAKTENGVCFIGNDAEQLVSWHEKGFPDDQLVYDESALEAEKAELEEFYAGLRKQFSFSVDFHGTPFAVRVWQELLDIPYGETVSYSDIAERIGRKGAVRAVGRAIGLNPVWVATPCHRVVGKDGKLTGYAGGLEMKRQLLEIEAQNK
ncbi:methylated DNA-protein cysteine methyltransferase [Listeria floridensis FSL S10-1187]|uniref:Methylated DNA-protein cysteine methyltransferase n=1 Tax=Listeria floridensis FSL S10-1187 TaxID=1265817 RepID=A0ABN0REG8_9LIST|nr:methylated-DNA--[protein]-cysteine S-methyltransferase [Listeria floridensis]EUJ31276.1 methylated DNA-protein cysteine methyltransferase [Listeria floridensis FSL S10-1187]